jgi:succinoglycan biosynthesis transport protein ExoP
MDEILNLDEPREPERKPDPVVDISSRLTAAPEFTGGPDARRPMGGGYVPGAAPVIASIDRRHLVDYFRIIYKRRVVVLATFAIVLGATALYTFTATPLFDARVQLLIENEEANVVNFEQVVEENRQTVDYYQTQYRILQSRVLARRTLDAEKLWDHPLIAPTESGFAGRLWNSVKSFARRSAPPPAPSGAAETAMESRVIDGYLSHLRVTPVRNSRLVDVFFSTPDPQFSARVANAHARAYIEQNLEFKFLASKEAADWLADRMGEQRKQVEASEQALQRYREQTGAMALEDRQNIVVQRLADLNAAVTKARTERIEKEAVYNQIREIQADRSAIDTFPAILNNGFIQQLKVELNQLHRQRGEMSEKLGARHPDMVKVESAIETTETRIAAEVQKVIRALHNDYQAAYTNERTLAAALDQQRAEAQELNRASIQYGALQRDAQSNRELFQGLMQRTRETGISTDLKTNNIRVVDLAEPPRRQTSPARLSNMLLGLFGGLFMALGIAFFLEYVDGRIKSPQEITEALGLPCLGMIPAVSPVQGKHDPLLTGAAPHMFVEAAKAVRTNLLFSSADESSKTVVVTSTGPGEGKTVVAANLAIALAQAGQRVLVMDCDMRRPRLHELIPNKLEPGLSNIMVGDAKAADAVRKTTTQNLWVLPAGKHPPNPAELLGSRRFRDFVKGLKDHFDWIILDSPPVMAVTDAAVIAHLANGVVFVVGAEMTQRAAARRALDQLEAAKAHFFGVVLNRVDLDRHPYYYSSYYKKEYTRYYTAS